MVFHLFKLSTVGEKEVGSVQELKENEIYSRGNHRDLMAFLEKQTNKNKPKVKICNCRQKVLRLVDQTYLKYVSPGIPPTKKLNDVIPFRKGVVA